MEEVVDPAAQILDEITALEVERARAEAKIAARMLDFQDLRRVEAERHDDPRTRDLQASFAADELGTVLHQPTRTVQCRLAEARRVRNLMPNAWEAFTAGRIDAYRVGLIASAAAKLTDNYQRIDLDHVIGSYAATHTPAQLKGKLKRFVASRVTDDRAVKTEKAKRSVWLDHQDDGMTFLHAYIATTDALKIDALVTERAKKATSDATFDQKRADEFVAQMLGEPLSDAAVRSRTVIGIVVPATSLAGLDDQPGESIDGSFALPAEMVRDLARQPGTLFYRVMKDPPGRILDITELGRFASDKLDIAIDIRDGTCRFPTCSRPAFECDDDHEIPHPRGPTNGANLRNLCRRHHRVKTARIAEPTDLVMRDRGQPPRELDFAHFITRMTYAA